MKKYFLHGMGGSPKDWDGVLQKSLGTTLEISSQEKIDGAIKNLATQIQQTKEIQLIGYSMGGRLAVLLAKYLLDKNSPLSKICLISAGMGPTNDEAQATRREADLAWARLARSNTPEFWEKWYNQNIFSSFHSLPHESRASWMKHRLSIDSNILAGQLERLSPSNHPYLLPTMKELIHSGIKVLYIVGELDKKYLIEAQTLKEIGAEIRVIPGAGHILPLEAPGALAEILNHF